MTIYDGMELEEILSVVGLINDEQDLIEDTVGETLFLSIEMNLYYCRIDVGDYALWDTEEGCRRWIDDGYNQEPLIVCLIRRLNDFVKVTKRIQEACLNVSDSMNKKIVEERLRTGKI